MVTEKKYENYPVGTVLMANSVTLIIYGLGLFIIGKIGIPIALLYLVYILLLEINLLRNHCTNCYYWGKICGFGQGRLSSLFFKKGNNKKFCAKKLTWKDMIPDLLASLIPFLTGIILLMVKFDFIILAALVLQLLLTTIGNGFIRGSMTCSHCKQLDLGCPAVELFNKGKGDRRHEA